MDSVQLHLVFTHVPVILSLVGLAMLIVALILKNDTLTKTSYFILLIAGIAALPVYFSGEGAEEAVEHLPGVSEGIIEKHEEIAKTAMISIAVAGILAFSALMVARWRLAARYLKFLVLFIAIISGGLMAYSAHLGGQIRHTEIRTGVTLNGQQEGAAETPGLNSQAKDDDD